VSLLTSQFKNSAAMLNSKAGQPTGNQIALPTDQLYAAASRYSNNENGQQSQMQKAMEVGSYFLSGCMAYEALSPYPYDICDGPLTLVVQGQHFAIPRCPVVPYQPGLVQCLDSINKAIFRPSNDNTDSILGSNGSQGQWRQKRPGPIDLDS